MDVVIERCAGLDVHKRTVVATIRTPDGGRQAAESDPIICDHHGRPPRAETWLTEAAVSHVAMESTGVYWRPVYAVLEDTCRSGS